MSLITKLKERRQKKQTAIMAAERWKCILEKNKSIMDELRRKDVKRNVLQNLPTVRRPS